MIGSHILLKMFDGDVLVELEATSLAVSSELADLTVVGPVVVAPRPQPDQVTAVKARVLGRVRISASMEARVRVTGRVIA